MSDIKQKRIDQKFFKIREEVLYIIWNTYNRYLLISDDDAIDEYKKNIRTKQDVINGLIPEIMSQVDLFLEKGIWNIILNYMEEEIVYHIDDGIESLIRTDGNVSNLVECFDGRNKYKFPIGRSFYGIDIGIKFIYYTWWTETFGGLDIFEVWRRRNGVALVIIYKKNGKCDIIDCIEYGHAKYRYNIAFDVECDIKYDTEKKIFINKNTEKEILFKKFEI